MMKIEVFCFDLDGTLLNSSGMMSTKTINFLKKLLLLNKTIIFASGRSLDQIEKIAKVIGAKKGSRVVLIGLGGAVSYSYISNKRSYHSSISSENKTKIVKKLNDFQIDFYAYSLSKSYLYKNEVHIKDIFKNILKVLLNKQLFVVNRKKVIKNVCKIQYFGENVIFKHMDYPELSFNKNIKEIEIINKKTSKLSTLLLYFNNLKQILYFGDSENDLSCLDFLPNSVAMENADDIIKVHAKYITKQNNNDDGVIDFIMHNVDFS